MISRQDMPISIDMILQECLPDPISYHLGETARSILTAWDGESIDWSKLLRAHAHFEKLLELRPDQSPNMR